MVQRIRDKRPRMLAPSRILRPPPRQTGGGRPREELVAEARAAIERGSRALALAGRLLDRATRERAWLLYAWWRRCDALADDQDFGGRMAEELEVDHRIKAMRILTQRALDGQPTADAAFDAFGQVAREAGLGADMAEDVIAGFALDAAGWRPRSEAELMRYCYHSGGVRGAMMARIMGVPPNDGELLDRACDLGLALRLIGIARDMCDDDAIGRCYLPVEWLAEADIPPGEHMKPVYREQLVVLVCRLLVLAESHAAAGRLGIAALPFRQRWAVLAAIGMFGAIAEELRERGVTAWDHRATVSRAAKLRLVSRAFFEALHRREELVETPRWTRGELLIAIRMAGPIAPVPMTPLPDEDNS